MIDGRGLALLAICAGGVSCSPVNPSAGTLAGRWKVDWDCGVEELELKANGTYSHSINFAAGGHVADSGTWKLVPKTEHLSGAHVVLQDTIDVCPAFAGQPGRTDRELETVWEWGRTVLLFNPDIQGFTRE